MKELEQSLQASEEKLKQSSDVVTAQEAQIRELVSGDHVYRVLGPDSFFCALEVPRLTPNSWNGIWTLNTVVGRQAVGGSELPGEVVTGWFPPNS